MAGGNSRAYAMPSKSLLRCFQSSMFGEGTVQPAGGGCFIEHHQPIRIRVGQGIPEYAIDDCEHRGVDADSERYGQYSQQCKARPP